MGQVIWIRTTTNVPSAATWAHEDQEACGGDLTDPVGLSERRDALIDLDREIVTP